MMLEPGIYKDQDGWEYEVKRLPSGLMWIFGERLQTRWGHTLNSVLAANRWLELTPLLDEPIKLRPQ